MPVEKWASSLPWDKICKAAFRHQVPRMLVGAIVYTESSGNTFAMRYEPTWEHFLTPHIFATNLGITVETEKICQATSWGLMQVMGAVARELQWNESLARLLEPDVGLDLGCRKLRNLIGNLTMDEAVSAYNAGTARRKNGKFINQEYVTKVINRYNALSMGMDNA